MKNINEGEYENIDNQDFKPVIKNGSKNKRKSSKYSPLFPADESGKKVLIAAPVHNRGWILPKYLNGILSLDYPHELISLFWIVNDSFDDTLEILTAFAEDHDGEFAEIDVQVKHFEGREVEIPGERKAAIRHKSTYPVLAELRNMILDYFLESDNDFLFSLDTDIIVTPPTVSRLLRREQDAVAAIIQNGAGHIYNFMQKDIQGQYHRDMSKAPPKDIFQVALTGASLMLSKKAAAAGRYRATATGEDQGFCEDLRAAGIGIFLDPTLKLEHVMRP